MRSKLGQEDRPKSITRNEDLKCWKTGSDPQCLTIEFSDGTQFLLPYGYFEGAKFLRDGELEVLFIQFKTNHFSIQGKALGDLVSGLQALSVEWLREIPARYRRLASGTGGLIEKIEIVDSIGGKSEDAISRKNETGKKE